MSILLGGNGLNMVRAALYSIIFFGFLISKFINSFSVKKKLRLALYFLLADGVLSQNVF